MRVKNKLVLEFIKIELAVFMSKKNTCKITLQVFVISTRIELVSKV